MDWKKISIERLREYEARKEALSLIPEQIETLELNFPALRSARTDATPVSGGMSNKREDMLINNIVMRDELAHNLEIAKREVSITEKGLEKLTEEQKEILTKFYINRSYGYIDTLCEQLHLEKSRIYTLKDEAVKKFTMACYGIVEV